MQQQAGELARLVSVFRIGEEQAVLGVAAAGAGVAARGKVAAVRQKARVAVPVAKAVPVPAATSARREPVASGSDWEEF
jgi:hypothetical protein